MTTINFQGKPVELEIVELRYSDNNRLALQVLCREGVFGFLTTNLPEANLAEDEVAIKTWSENSLWAPQILEQLKDRLTPTGRSIPTGFVTAPIYKYKAS